MVKEGQLVGGRYRVLAALSQGGSATVYSVEHTVLQTGHALKVLRAPTPDARKRLLREGQLQARLRHEHLILITDAFPIAGDNIGLVMELANGPTLRQQLQERTLSLAEATSIGEGLLEGVAYAHASGLIHRDIKPENILLCGTERIPRLADFGLVKQVFERPEGGDTRTGVMMGTPGYMPPEQYTDAGRVDARADVFSLGAVLYELLAGHPAFSGPPDAQLRQAVRGEIPPLPGHLPDHLKAAVMGALEPDLTRRIPSVGALLERWRQPGVPLSNETLQPLLDLAPTGNLPITTDRFIGRDRELAALESMLVEGALVTLRGPGGTGKTRLSLEAGRALRERFSGGVWFIDLAEAHTLEGVCGATAQALSVPLQGADPVDALGWILRRRSPALFILDNFEQVVSQAMETVGRWRQRAGEATFLVTSRIPLDLSGEQILDLAPFTPPPEGADAATVLANPGARLLEDRTRARAQDFALTAADADDVATLLRGLDGMPLAIELVAPRLARRSLASVCATLARKRLTMASRRRDRPDRQKTLRSTIAWSWALLSEPERAALMGCAVFEGAFDPDAAEAVVVVDDDTEDVLEQLVEQSLLRHDRQTDRYTLLVSIRDFAAEQLALSPLQDTIGGRHLAHFAQKTAAQIRQEGGLDDLVVAAGRLPDPDAARAALTAGEVFHDQGPVRRALPLLQAALDVSGLSDTLRARLWTCKAACHLAMIAFEDVDACLAEGLACARAAGDVHIEGRALLLKTRSLWMRSRYPEALQVCRQAAEMLQATGDAAAVVEARCQWGHVLRWTGDRDGAGEQYEVALTLGRKSSERARILALSNVGMHYDYAGRSAEALQAYRESAAWMKAHGEHNHLATVRGNLAFSLRNMGRFAEARRVYEEAIQGARDVGDRLNEGMWMLHLARLCFVERDFAACRRIARESLAVTRSVKDTRTEGVALRVLAEAALRDGDEAVVRRCLVEMEGKGDWIVRGSQALLSGLLAVRAGDREAAEPLLQQAVEILKRGDSEGTVWATVTLGRMALEEGRRTDAEEAMASLRGMRAIPVGVQELVADFAVELEIDAG